MSNSQPAKQNTQISNGALLIGAGLAVASFIVLPAVAARIGVGSSLTGAMRIVLMKASTRICNNTNNTLENNNQNLKESCPDEAECQQPAINS